MSYTHQKISWESCYRQDTDLTTYLLDADGNSLVDIEYQALVYGDTSHVDIYGDSIMDEYCDIARTSVVDIIARKQPHEEVFKDNSGLELLSRSYFYVDPLIEPNALKIGEMDKLDGETVRKKYIMYDLMGKPKMVRFITV